MNALERFQNWFLSECDGDWEHQNGISISTLDNPGWMVVINLRGTLLDDRQFSRHEIERTSQDWMHAWKSGEEFNVACGPRNLEEALCLFCDWAEDSHE